MQTTPAPRVAPVGALLCAPLLTGFLALGLQLAGRSIHRPRAFGGLLGGQWRRYEVASLPISSEMVSGGDSEAVVFLVKELAYLGHPPERVSISDMDTSWPVRTERVARSWSSRRLARRRRVKVA